MDEIKKLVEEYVERYSRCRGITKEEALDHLLVKYVAEYYAEELENKEKE